MKARTGMNLAQGQYNSTTSLRPLRLGRLRTMALTAIMALIEFRGVYTSRIARAPRVYATSFRHASPWCPDTSTVSRPPAARDESADECSTS